MCTVTLTAHQKKENGFILTSNRDEAAGRESLAPGIYFEKGVKMLYPKDKLAGGTWIGISERKRSICLLNGEFEPHIRKENYRLSRGVVVKDLLAATSIDKVIDDYVLDDIEPFTIVGIDWSTKLRFLELVWDGEIKHLKELNLKPHIWSSSPLYTAPMKKSREEWFRDFQNENGLNADSLWNFHTTAGIGDSEIDVVMDRGFIRTQNITQIENIDDSPKLRFMDLRDQNKIEFKF